MEQLYKGRYLIVLYRKNGDIKDVLTSVSKNRASYIAKVFNGHLKDDYIDFIDVFEKHNDCFAEEDKLFLDFLKEQKIFHYRTQAEKIKKQKKKYYEANARWKRRKIIEQYEEKRVAL